MDVDALALEIQFQLYREEMEQPNDDDDDDDDDLLPNQQQQEQQQQPERDQQQHQRQPQQHHPRLDAEEEDELDDAVPPLPSVREELDDLMNAMKFRVYYEEDDPRGDLTKTNWEKEEEKEEEEEEEEKEEEQYEYTEYGMLKKKQNDNTYSEDKRKGIEEQQRKPIYRLIKAVQKDNLEEVKSIVQSTGVSVNAEMQFHTPLGMGVFVGAERVVEFLLDAGANANGLCATTESIMEQHPLMIAVRKRDYEVARLLLLRGGANPNCQDTARLFPLFEAVNMRNTEMVMLLLNNGANPNLSDYHRSTPLHRACVRDDPDIVELLLMFGAKTEVHDSHGIGPIHKACQLTSSSCLHHLLKFGAALESETAGGETPLVWAARQVNVHNLECSGLLIEAGANMSHCPEGSDMTPLRSAWQRRKVETVLQLLLAGVDVTKESWIKDIEINSNQVYIWHRELYLTILNFKAKMVDLREICRRVIRRHFLENGDGKSMIGPISDLEIWPVMKDFLLMKDLPRTQIGIERIVNFDSRLRNLRRDDDDESEDDDVDDEDSSNDGDS